MLKIVLCFHLSNSVSQIKASECHGIDANILNTLKAIIIYVLFTPTLIFTGK